MNFLSCGGALNHHGKFICDEMHKILKNNFIRITTKATSVNRISLGYDASVTVPYNKEIYTVEPKIINELISWADVVDYGDAPEPYLEKAVKEDKIVFIRLERLFKEGYWKILVPKITFKYYRKYIKYRNKPNVYYLCVGKHVAKDLSVLGIHNDRVLKWAYCTEFKEMNIKKSHHKKMRILWCGRLIRWKHPEAAIMVGLYLKKTGIPFTLDIIGNGPMEKKIRRLIKKYNLDKCIRLLGSKKHDTVRTEMESSDVLLFTSDRNEGWGAVVNEAMNSGCVVLGTVETGSVPSMIIDGENGFYIKRKTPQKTANIIVELFNNPDRMLTIKKASYNTIRSKYTPECCAKRLIELAADIKNGNNFQYNHQLGERIYK